MKYAPPLHTSAPDAGYADPVEGTIPAAAVEQPLREIASVIASMGIVPSETDLTQLNQAVDMKIAAMQPDLSEVVPAQRTMTTDAPLYGGGSLAADLVLGIRASSDVLAEHVVLRDAHGRAQVAEPRAAADIVTKAYSDAGLQELNSNIKTYVDTVVAHALRPACRTPHDSDLTLYIRTDGNDAHSGRADTPQQALASFEGARRIMRTLDMRGNALIVSFGPGTHAPALLQSGDECGAGIVVLQSTDPATPAFLDTADNYAVRITCFAQTVRLQDLRLRAAACCLLVDKSLAYLSGVVSCQGRSDGIQALNAACVSLNAGAVLALSGPGSIGLHVGHCSIFNGSAGTLRYDAPVFTKCGVYANTNSVLLLPQTVTGSATGRRYTAAWGGKIYAGGRGAQLLPGTIAGSCDASSYAFYG